jgi:hypothetical protein
MSVGGYQGQYEFTEQQNQLLGNLASKMAVVGTFLTVVGGLELLAAVVAVAAALRSNFPPDLLARIPADVHNRLPGNSHLWAFAIQGGVAGLLYLLMGTWTSSSAASFRQIVETRGSDITHLMNALGALNRMYTLIYTIVLFVVVMTVLAIVMLLLSAFAR